MIFSGPSVWAEEKAKTTASSSGGGGMTYSPAEGWVKTDSQHMKVGTDALTYQGKKQAIAEGVKKNAEKIAAAKTEAEMKEKLWKESKTAEAQKSSAQVQTAEPASGNKKSTAIQKSKMPSSKSRVLVA